MIDYTITIGNLIEIASIAGGGLIVILRMNNNLISIKNGMSNSLVSIKSDVLGMQEEIKELGKVMTQMAVTNTRVEHLEQDIRDLRRGKGWITGNFNRSVDGEYP